MKAKQDETSSLKKNNTYELVQLLNGRKHLRNKWVFKLKKDDIEKLVKHKERLAVKGFAHTKGIDFDEIFSKIVKMTYVQVVLCLAAGMGRA